MPGRKIRGIASVVSLLLGPLLLQAQNPLTRDSRVGIPPFEIDFAAFADTAGQARLEVYYKLRNAGFTFAKKEERYAAGYELEIFVTGPDGREAGSKRASEEFSVENYEQTQSGESYRVNAAHFRLPPGSYRIKVQLTDQVSGEVFSTARKAEVPDFKTPALSDLELIGAFADSAGLPLFQKNGRTAIPSVTRAFGAADSLLPFFFELYASPARSPGWELVYEITQRYHGRWSAETLRVRPEEGVTPFFADLPLKNLPPGEYRLKLALKEGKKELARREADFKMNWNWEAALVYNFGDVLEILAYFSRAADLKELKKAAASKRRERWDEFWAGRDPTPATRENEAKDEFDRRVRFTDAYFGHMGLPGWKSDMGKIYIRFGEPDQVDEDPTGLRNTNPHLGESDGYASTASRLRSFGHPTQTWYYFADRRAFSFEDVTGNGSWVLKPPLDGRRF